MVEIKSKLPWHGMAWHGMAWHGSTVRSSHSDMPVMTNGHTTEQSRGGVKLECGQQKLLLQQGRTVQPRPSKQIWMAASGGLVCLHVAISLTVPRLRCTANCLKALMIHCCHYCYC